MSYYLFFLTEVFEDSMEDILISDQIVLDYVFKKFLKGLLTLELHIYHGVSPYFFHWVLRSFAWYIDILWFFPTGFFQSLKTIIDGQIRCQ